MRQLMHEENDILLLLQINGMYIIVADEIDNLIP